MALVTSSWDRPIQGVSQQPPKIRISGQSSVQENALSSVVRGLIKRPGTSRIASLLGSLPKETAFYYYNRGTTERYFVIIPPSSIPRVFDIAGNELVVENELLDNAYLVAGNNNPASNLRLNTISDFTFIANRTVTPKQSNATTGMLNNKVIINVQFCDYGRDYIITVDGTEVAKVSTPDGGRADQITQVDTSFVAFALANGDNRDDPGTIGPEDSGFEIVGGLNTLPDYTVELRGNTIILERNNGADFDIATQDGADGRDLFAVKNLVKEVTELPRYAPEGYLVQVVGSGSSNADTYWLVAEDVSGDAVRWVEAAGPSQTLGFDAYSMPHVLIRDRFEAGLAVFKLKTAPWADRDVGDDDTNPMPSFVQDGFPITSVGTFQNRLYFTAGESVVMSRSNYFFQFFRQSVRTALDDDPIDVYADTNQVNLLRNSAVLDGDIVFFSANGQFLLSGQEAITKDNATLQYASTFENIDSCPPVAGGDVIFFAFEYGRYTGIREFYTDSFTDTKRARPITDHVDEYILGRATQLASSTNKNQLMVLASEPGVVYVYSWLWQGEDRVQSSWSKWILSGDIRFVQFDNELLYFLVDRAGSLDLEVISLGDPDDAGVTFPVRLDRRVAANAVRVDNHWEVSVPYNLGADERLVIVRGDGCIDAGVTTDFDFEDGVAKIDETLSEDSDTVGVIVGVSYTMRYEPTMPFIKDRNDRVIDTDRLIINDININYDKTGRTSVVVENDWGSTREYEFNGRRLGNVNNIIGFAPIAPGQFSFPVRQDSDRTKFQLVTDSHIPFQLRDMEWRGRFRQRGRRV